jgi:bifunctional non-homologous end joining protein LigD
VAPERISVTVEGQVLSLSNLNKILYPDVGFTKAEVIDYYSRVGPVMLPHVVNRCVTMKRYPDGVNKPSFFNKRCPDHRPPFVGVARGPGESDGPIDYCLIDSQAALVWAANMASLEIHLPMAHASDLATPTLVVFDLDPGEGTSIVECAQVGLSLKQVLDAVGLLGFPKTSGSKGLQVYLPVNTPTSHKATAEFALAVGQLLTRQHPKQVLVNMNKAERRNKVFVDWSQNAHFKTTIGVYSMRAKSTPTVSTPVTWDEVADAADGEPLSFTTADVLERVGDLGDLFAPTLTLKQSLPRASG